MHKPGQGMFSRSFIMALMVLFGAYSGYNWYLTFYSSAVVSLGSVGGVFWLLALSGLGVYVTLYNPRSVDFLIDMDSELRKVQWPETTPMFSPKAEAWGATAVVIITVVVFAVFIYLVDIFLSYSVQDLLLFKLLQG